MVIRDYCCKRTSISIKTSMMREKRMASRITTCLTSTYRNPRRRRSKSYKRNRYRNHPRKNNPNRWNASSLQKKERSFSEIVCTRIACYRHLLYHPFFFDPPPPMEIVIGNNKWNISSAALFYSGSWNRRNHMGACTISLSDRSINTTIPYQYNIPPIYPSNRMLWYSYDSISLWATSRDWWCATQPKIMRMDIIRGYIHHPIGRHMLYWCVRYLSQLLCHSFGYPIRNGR